MMRSQEVKTKHQQSTKYRVVVSGSIADLICSLKILVVLGVYTSNGSTSVRTPRPRGMNSKKLTARLPYAAAANPFLHEGITHVSYIHHLQPRKQPTMAT
mgnify:CR=1 FL=1